MVFHKRLSFTLGRLYHDVDISFLIKASMMLSLSSATTGGMRKVPIRVSFESLTRGFGVWMLLRHGLGDGLDGPYE